MVIVAAGYIPPYGAAALFSMVIVAALFPMVTVAAGYIAPNVA
jgi:hypothetical protein